MSFQITDLPGLLLFTPKVHHDDRGYFFEAFNENVFKQERVDCRFVQDNQSQSAYGVIRGLHYQLNPHAQAKLVRVLQGRILDVVVDIRKNSRTYGRHFSIELSADNKKQLFVPSGFAHGFSVLSEQAEVLYKCDQFYNKDSEAGIRFNDQALGIDWGIPEHRQKISERDASLPLFADVVTNFVFEN